MPDPNDDFTPPYSIESQLYDPTGLPLPPPPDLSAATITITGPPQGQIIAAGSSVDLTFTPDPGTKIAWIIAGASDANGPVAAAAAYNLFDVTNVKTNVRAFKKSLVATLTIPPTRIGNVKIGAMAVDTLGNPAGLETSIWAQTAATVQSLAIVLLNPPTFSGVGQSMQLQAKAVYSDEISRDVTAAGTIYAPADPSVITVSSTGLITAVGPGTTQVTCTNGGASSSFIVTVNLQSPSIFSVTPLGAVAGQTVLLRLSGLSFGGLMGIQFLTPAGVPDPNVTVSELSLEPNTYNLTANVTIAGNCPPGADTIVLTAAGGSSRRDPAPVHNVFTIFPSSDSLSLSSTTATGGQTLTGTLLLSAPATEYGETVTVTSSDPSVTLPAPIPTYPGQTFKSFPITTSPVTTPVTVTISAIYHGTTTTAILIITPEAY